MSFILLIEKAGAIHFINQKDIKMYFKYIKYALFIRLVALGTLDVYVFFLLLLLPVNIFIPYNKFKFKLWTCILKHFRFL